MLPFANYGFKSSKQHIWDSINLRYSWVTSKLPTTCPCGRRFDVQHSMICTKRGFITFRHDNLRHLKTKIPTRVWGDTNIEAKPVSLSGDNLNKITVNKSNEVKLNIRAPSFWKREQQTFFKFRNI